MTSFPDQVPRKSCVTNTSFVKTSKYVPWKCLPWVADRAFPKLLTVSPQATDSAFPKLLTWPSPCYRRRFYAKIGAYFEILTVPYLNYWQVGPSLSYWKWIPQDILKVPCSSYWLCRLNLLAVPYLSYWQYLPHLTIGAFLFSQLLTFPLAKTTK